MCQTPPTTAEAMTIAGTQYDCVLDHELYREERQLSYLVKRRAVSTWETLVASFP